MNTIRNIAGLVVLGSFIVACSTEAGGSPEEQRGSESAETSSTDAKKDTKDAKKSDTANSDTKGSATEKNGIKIPGIGDVNVPGVDGADGADGADDGVDFPDFPAGGGDDNGGTTIENGGISTNGGHVGSNNDCCFQGQYFECPDANACFGGFDMSACMDACANDFKCMMGCSDKMSSAGGPKGCTQKAAPANIKCQ